MNIGQASAGSGVSAKMIRYYGAIGLIPEVQRTATGYRVYVERDVHTLSFIRRARDLGFPVEQIRELLALWRRQNRESAEVKRLALAHIDTLRHKVSELEEMIEMLSDLADRCRGDHGADCPIIDDLVMSRHEGRIQSRKPRLEGRRAL